MAHPCHIGSLADELLNDILSFLVAWSDEAASSRYHHRPNQPSRKLKEPIDDRITKSGERSDLDRFRLVCRRFMRIGTPWRFSRFVLRFSREGFRRLNDLLDMQLACHTKYFTYMVRPFYQGRGMPQLSSRCSFLFSFFLSFFSFCFCFSLTLRD
jgi:hypothetical protein